MDSLPIELILHVGTFLTRPSLAVLIRTSRKYATIFTKELYDAVLLTPEGDDKVEQIPWLIVPRRKIYVWKYAKCWKSALITNYFSNIPLESPFDHGFTWVHIFAIFDSMHLIELFIARGADFDIKSCSGETPLMLATAWCRVDIVGFLLNLGADMLYFSTNSPGGYSISSFESAIRSTNLELARLFIETVGDVNIDLPRMTGKPQKPLHIAAEASPASITKLLLANGADPFAYSTYMGVRQTALHIASLGFSLDTCQHLVNAMKAANYPPCSIFLLDDRGNCPLAYATDNEVAILLIEAGKDQPCRNCGGKPVNIRRGIPNSLLSNCGYNQTA